MSDTVRELSGGRIYETIHDLAAKDDVPADTRLRMLIASLAVANWATLQMLFLYVTDLQPARPAIQMSVFVSVIAFGAYLVFSRLTHIARGIELLIGQREVQADE